MKNKYNKMNWMSDSIIFYLFFMCIIFSKNAKSMEVGEFLEQFTSHSVLMIMNPTQNSECAGTGFYLYSSNRIFLVTAKHVLFGPDPNSTNFVASECKLISYGMGQQKELLATNIVAIGDLWKRHLIRVHNTKDVAVVALGTKNSDGKGVKLENGVTCITPNIMIYGFNFEDTVRFDTIKVGSQAYIIGFPRSLGQPTISPPSIDPDRPLFRHGIIAGKNPKKSDIIVDAAAYQGNSGGPLIVYLKPSINMEVLKVAGVITKFVGFERVLNDNRGQGFSVEIVNSGYAIAVPIDFVLDILWN
jgi:hypothetical protein